MAIAIRTTDFPEGGRPDMYEAVTAEMEFANAPSSPIPR